MARFLFYEKLVGFLRRRSARWVSEMLSKVRAPDWARASEKSAAPYRVAPYRVPAPRKKALRRTPVADFRLVGVIVSAPRIEFVRGRASRKTRREFGGRWISPNCDFARDAAALTWRLCDVSKGWRGT